MSLLVTWLFQLGRRRLLAGLPNAVLSADTDLTTCAAGWGCITRASRLRMKWLEAALMSHCGYVRPWLKRSHVPGYRESAQLILFGVVSAVWGLYCQVQHSRVGTCSVHSLVVVHVFCAEPTALLWDFGTVSYVLRCHWLVRCDTAKRMAQVFFSYTPACRRNDYSLFHYGFLQRRDPPRLCALDTPGGSLYTPSGLDEDRDYGANATRSHTQAGQPPIYARVRLEPVRTHQHVIHGECATVQKRNMYYCCE